MAHGASRKMRISKYPLQDKMQLSDAVRSENALVAVAKCVIFEPCEKSVAIWNRLQLFFGNAHMSGDQFSLSIRQTMSNTVFHRYICGSLYIGHCQAVESRES